MTSTGCPLCWCWCPVFLVLRPAGWGSLSFYIDHPKAFVSLVTHVYTDRLKSSDICGWGRLGIGEQISGNAGAEDCGLSNNLSLQAWNGYCGYTFCPRIEWEHIPRCAITCILGAAMLFCACLGVGIRSLSHSGCILRRGREQDVRFHWSCQYHGDRECPPYTVIIQFVLFFKH